MVGFVSVDGQHRAEELFDLRDDVRGALRPLADVLGIQGAQVGLDAGPGGFGLDVRAEDGEREDLMTAFDGLVEPVRQFALARQRAIPIAIDPLKNVANASADARMPSVGRVRGTTSPVARSVFVPSSRSAFSAAALEASAHAP